VFDSRKGQGISPLATLSTRALWPTQPTWMGGPGLLSKGIRVSFPGSKAAGAVKLTTELHLVPRTRMRGAIPPLAPICLHVVLS
jgi:hypothetical protein